jgi:hypothetical protein
MGRGGNLMMKHAKYTVELIISPPPYANYRIVEPVACADYVGVFGWGNNPSLLV